MGEAAIGADAEGVVATSNTVTASAITINAPAKIGQRIFLVSACGLSDVIAKIQLQNSTTPVFAVPLAAAVPGVYTPPRPVPVSSPGVTANFVVSGNAGVTTVTAGTLSVHYAYGI